MRRLIVIGAALVLTAGCEGYKEKRGRGDAPVERFNDAPAEVINMPNRFPNVAHKCDGYGHRIFSSTSGDGAERDITVVNDPSCGGSTR